MQPNHYAYHPQLYTLSQPEESLNPRVEDEGRTPERRVGRKKIKIEYIQDKSRRHITFSKRKAGIMKKAYELSTLTGTQVLLLVVSETGLVYTFTTPKLQPVVTKPEGKNLIQSCLNAPDPPPEQIISTSNVGSSSRFNNTIRDFAKDTKSLNQNMTSMKDEQEMNTAFNSSMMYPAMYNQNYWANKQNR
ncbi:hypothetical protein G6F57_000331 [Rhizopus arrhizus]|uniref:MADS-box domain-containing protein n=1 Tax=Rhizopus oryzae TaxID=64495 RepID=A0A9P6XKJ3_RHIOR|nr:hypothetical protein G6F23_006168 [Rhizopus arrhizus]KAG1422404.1 hypothetical protein G6F58_003321 [Rhizopus delemar]KAG0770300.1 hypothetical protein G6F24_000321 [Rhizopus arrhizus]KAG0797662.1 hypothetical protein G6F21_000339 [Rhizopus arrhizus]KAG0799787.1 hypothetical protein G6F22_002881 [Rhizopus arrhizus]